jgi:hypothetical protein
LLKLRIVVLCNRAERDDRIENQTVNPLLFNAGHNAIDHRLDHGDNFPILAREYETLIVARVDEQPAFDVLRLDAEVAWRPESGARFPRSGPHR